MAKQKVYTEYSEIEGKKFTVNKTLDDGLKLVYTIGRLNKGWVFVEWEVDGSKHETDYTLGGTLFNINNNTWTLKL